MSKNRYTCPCCGYRTLKERPGNYSICHVCFWEDDPVQLLDPWCVSGANKVSLQQAQQNFATGGVSEPRFKGNVKGVLAGDVRDPSWRQVTDADKSKVTTPAHLGKEMPNGSWPWYYWAENA